VFHDWVVPIALGLAIGGAGIGAWKLSRGAFHSKAWMILEKWADEDADGNEGVAKELQALGPSARGDVVESMRDLPRDQTEVKIWVARLVAAEPWFDTASLKEIARDANAPKEDRRAAACALIDVQNKEVDAELVLPVIESWLQDADSPDRGIAIGRLEHMWRAGMLNSQWEGRSKKALIEMAKRVPPKKPDDADRIIDDRASALLLLQMALPDDDVKKLLWTVAKDDTDDELVRVNCVRSLAEGHVLDEQDVDDWVAVAKAGTGVVRQAVADNLQRAQVPSYDKVLEPLQFDANPLARSGALDTQIKRRRPTMLARFDELLEDSYEWVRFGAMYAAGLFKNETDGIGPRTAMMLRLLETSEDPVDVMGAALAMKMITGEVYGFRPEDVHIHEQSVEESSLRTFMSDAAGRKQAADKWRVHLGATAVWTDGDREKTLGKLLTHADPKNAERAKIALEMLRKK
jgi:hypothetical protein